MRKYSILTIVLLFLSSLILFAQGDPDVASPESSIDWFQVIVTIGYLGGVFILFPWVIYTNLKEKLFVVETEFTVDSLSNTELTEDERNSRAALLLEEIENRLTPIKDEESGEELKTITKGSQARFIKRSIEYIQQNLKPTDPDTFARMNEIITVYEDRTKRIFTGSKWIIGFAVGVGLLLLYQAGLSTFIFIHFIGVVFYIMSSHTPLYLLEKRMKMLGNFGGVLVGSIVSGLFVGAGAKHYNVYSDGRKERDYSSELTGGAVYFLILAVIAMILGFLAAALGVVNFLMNYMNNALIPTKLESWYEKEFAKS